MKLRNVKAKHVNSEGDETSAIITVDSGGPLSELLKPLSLSGGYFAVVKVNGQVHQGSITKDLDAWIETVYVFPNYMLYYFPRKEWTEFNRPTLNTMDKLKYGDVIAAYGALRKAKKIQTPKKPLTNIVTLLYF